MQLAITRVAVSLVYAHQQTSKKFGKIHLKERALHFGAMGLSRPEIKMSDEDALPRRKKHERLSALDEKNRRVEKFSSSLQEKHGDKFTKIQYRLWAEMVDVGTHKYVHA